MSLPVHTFYHYYCNFYHCCITYKCMTTSLSYIIMINYTSHLLYAGSGHVSTLECLYDCLLDNIFIFCRNKLILIYAKLPYIWSTKLLRMFSYCTINVKMKLFRRYCSSLYCFSLWSDFLFFFARKILFEKSSKTYSYINIYR